MLVSLDFVFPKAKTPSSVNEVLSKSGETDSSVSERVFFLLCLHVG